MATTIYPFLRFIDPVTNVTQAALAVVSYEEHEPWRRGGRQRTFDGTMVSTEGIEKFLASATVEFLTGADLEEFLGFVALGLTNDGFSRPFGARAVGMQTGPHTVVRGPRSFDRVHVHVGRRTPFEHVEPTGVGTLSHVVIGWTVELQIESV